MAKKKMMVDESDDESSDDASSNESSDSNTEELKSKSGKNVENKVDITEDFKLSCLHEWDASTLSLCLKNYLHTTKLDKETATLVDIPPKSSTNFNPWWDEFIKLEHHKSVVNSLQEPNQDSDTYDSWFNKDAVPASSWLCGSGPSSSSTLPSQKSDVEDIKVPSIYDNNVAPKGLRALKRERRAERAKDLGKKWFGMKAPDVDEKLRNDMELIRMRSVLDPKRFYKHQDRKALPKYFQMGTVVDEGTDFYSSRLTKKQRKQTLVEELMADANIRQYNKKKYAELQHKMRVKKKFKSKHPKK